MRVFSISEKYFFAIKITLSICISILLNTIIRIPPHLGILGVVNITFRSYRLQDVNKNFKNMFMDIAIGCMLATIITLVLPSMPNIIWSYCLLVILSNLSLYFTMINASLGIVTNTVFYTILNYVLSYDKDAMNYIINFVVRDSYRRFLGLTIGTLCVLCINLLLYEKGKEKQLYNLTNKIYQQSLDIINKTINDPLVLKNIEAELEHLDILRKELESMLFSTEHHYNKAHNDAASKFIILIEEISLFYNSFQSYIYIHSVNYFSSLFYQRKMEIFKDLIKNRYNDYIKYIKY